MNPAIIDQTSVDVAAGDYTFRATGSIVKFPGFMAVYLEEKAEDAAPSEDDSEAVLPPLTEGDALTLIKLDPKQHFTQPPPRFSEALLVKTLEEKGIGRPSTYAAIISTIQERDYVNKIENKFRPTELGVLVNDLLVVHFPVILDVAFTAKMEEELDKIEEGQMGWVEAVLQALQREPRKGAGRDERFQGRARAHGHHVREMRQTHGREVGQKRPVSCLQRVSGLQEHETLCPERERRGRGSAGRDHG
jgi:DNA topoisomerase-1